MTFLYKALLKEQAKDQAKSESNPDSSWQTNNPQWQSNEASTGAATSWSQDANATPSGWGNQGPNQAQWHAVTSVNSNRGWHWSAWLIVGLLLLVVGTLSGYLLGVQPWQKPSFNNSQNTSNVAFQKSDNQELADAQNKPSLVSANESTSATESNTKTPETQLAQTEDLSIGNSESTEPNNGETSEPMFVAKNGKISEEQSSSAPGPSPSQNTSSSSDPGLDEVTEQEKTITIDDYAPTSVEIDDVPDELKVAFEQAVAELEAEQNQDVESSDNSFVVETDSTLTDINSLTEQEQAGIPQLFYQMHIYASEPSSRWIKINDKTLYEGEYLNKNLKLVEIRQDIVVWETRYRRFSQVALQDYL